MRTSHVVFCLIGCVLFSMSGCFRETVSTTSAEPALSDGFYLFQENGLLPLEEFHPSDTGSFTPWPLALRCFGFEEQKDTLYLSVNTRGILPIRKNEKGLIPEPMVEFPECTRRSMGSFFAIDDEMYLHLYRNAFFTPHESQDRVHPVYRFDPQDKTLEELPLPFAESNPDWELVDLLPGKESWILAWKKTSAEQTLFRYTKYYVNDYNEAPLTRGDYLEGFQVRSIDKAPPVIQTLFEKVHDPSSGKVVQITLSAPSLPGSILYASVSPDVLKKGVTRIIELTAYAHGNVTYLFDGSNRIYWDETGGISGRIVLPELPEGFVYTDFWCDGRHLVAAWEEQKQHTVGTAGVYVKTVSIIQ